MAAKNRRRQHNNNSNNNGVQHTSDEPAETTTTTAATITTAEVAEAPASTTTTQINPITFESPLKIFGEAKEQINALYQRLDKCVLKASHFYSDQQLDPEILKNVDIERLLRISRSIETIRSVLSRNQMKVAFFGRTSNGKSTVINAILHDKVLPDGYGHTTACFLQIQGSEESEPYLEVQQNGQQGNSRQPIESVRSIGNALKAGSLEPSTLVNIYWPIRKCPLLKYDVVFVDSPGIDVEKNLDAWIDKHCHDADVFVLVANAESTITDTEKKFFHKVSEKLSKPNVFILNNRWDNIAEDPEAMSYVRVQHEKRAVNFLCDELKITTHEDAKSRTFFVSAKETLLDRSPSSARTPSNLNESFRREGHQERVEEFKNFERRFEESLSKSAVRTKFKQHADKGKETSNELTRVLNKTQSLVLQLSHDKQLELQQNDERFRSIQHLFYDNEAGLLHELAAIKKRIQIVADAEVDSEIRRLSRIVDDYEEPFSPDSRKLLTYKESLYSHVEEYLGENLKSRIMAVINKHVNPFNKAMCEIGSLLSEDRQNIIRQIVNSQIYVQDDLFDIRIYRQFYTEFQEDLEFRFSLGLVSIIRKFQSKFSAGDKSQPPLDGSFEAQKNLAPNADFLSIIERFLMNPPQSPTTVGSLAVGGILVRTVGWRVIVVTTVLYGALYAYEYLTWTNAAKERSFKAQYVKYARKGLQDCVPIISQHIANSVEQKMVQTFSEVKKEIDQRSEEVGGKVSLLRQSLDKLKVCDQFTTELLNENNVLMTELVAFATSFLGIQ